MLFSMMYHYFTVTFYFHLPLTRPLSVTVHTYLYLTRLAFGCDVIETFILMVNETRFKSGLVDGHFPFRVVLLLTATDRQTT
jgi:hypothetical protein